MTYTWRWVSVGFVTVLKSILSQPGCPCVCPLDSVGAGDVKVSHFSQSTWLRGIIDRGFDWVFPWVGVPTLHPVVFSSHRPATSCHEISPSPDPTHYRQHGASIPVRDALAVTYSILSPLRIGNRDWVSTLHLRTPFEVRVDNYI